MEPSSEKLAEIQLADAVQPQQKALQLLQRAEAVFKDIEVSQQQANGQDNPSSSQDMAEMFELEMDLAKNQYEVPDTGSSPRGAESIDDVFEKLRELAKRQQALQEMAERQQNLSSIERWQLEQLQRELQELQEQLQNSQQQASRQGQNSRQQQASQAAGQAAEKIEQTLHDLQQQDASENRRPEASQSENQAMREAGELLQEAIDSLTQQGRQDLQRQLGDVTESAQQLLDNQREAEDRLRQAFESETGDTGAISQSEGLSFEENRELAEQKRDMQLELDRLTRHLENTEKRFSNELPETSNEIRSALEALENSNTADNLGLSGDSIRMGVGERTLPLEASITSGLREFRDRLEEIASTASSESIGSERANQERQLVELKSAVQELRQLLDAESQRAGDNATLAEADRGSQQQGQAADSSGPGMSESASSPTRLAGRGESASGRDGWREGQSGTLPELSNTPTGTQGTSPLDDAMQRLIKSFDAVQVGAISVEQMQALQNITAQSASTFSGENAQRVAKEYLKLREQVEQLEIALFQGESEGGRKAVQSSLEKADMAGFESAVSEYYRSLSDLSQPSAPTK